MKLPDYPQRGEPLESTWARQVIDYLRSITPQTSTRCRVSTTANGTTYEPVLPRPRNVAEAGEAIHPFKAIMRAKPNGDPENPQYEWGIYYNSQLLNSLDVTDFLPVEFLLKKDPEDNDPGWADVLPTDAIWIERVPDGDKFTHRIKSWGAGDQWDDFPDIIELDDEGGKVKAARFLIAYTLPDEKGKPKLYPRLHSHLLLRTTCYQGVRTLYFYPYDGDGYANLHGIEKEQQK